MIPLYEKQGFIICFEAEEETVSMRHHFIKQCGWTEKDYRKLARTKPVWFCAKVSAWQDGKELGTDYLGCCCYDSVEQFIESSDYMPQMVEQAVSEARAALRSKRREQAELLDQMFEE